MSKKIRVAWDDLKPGDLIHVKGSTNTYVFKGWFLDAASVDHRKSGAETYVITRSKNNSPVDVAIVVTHDNFAYATRPAPKKKPRPSIVEPILPGEYWARIRFGSQTGWGRIIKRYAPRSDNWLFGHDDKAPYQTSWCGTLAGLHPWMTWEELLEVNKQTPILELLSAEEYYTRKAKGEL